MLIPTIICMTLFMSLLSMIFLKKFFLSVLLSLESVLLSLLISNFLISYFYSSSMNMSFSLFMLVMAAIEASMGMTILTLVTRNFKQTNMKTIKLMSP